MNEFLGAEAMVSSGVPFADTFSDAIIPRFSAFARSGEQLAACAEN